MFCVVYFRGNVRYVLVVQSLKLATSLAAKHACAMIVQVQDSIK